jgi:hypothetical protein
MAGLMDIFAISVKPDIALLLALGEIKVHLSPVNLEYIGNLVIHTCDYTSLEQEIESLKLIKNLGFQPEEIPTNAIIGYVNIQEIVKYNSNTFKQNSYLHLYEQDYNLFKILNNWQEYDIFGYKLNDFNYLETPIKEVSKYRLHGDWWTPENPFEILCFKKAFEGVLLKKPD